MVTTTTDTYNETLTRAEYEALESLRAWTTAQSNPTLYARLEARELLLQGIAAAENGTAERWCQEWGLTAADVCTLRAAADFLKRL